MNLFAIDSLNGLREDSWAQTETKPKMKRRLMGTPRHLVSWGENCSARGESTHLCAKPRKGTQHS
jgi:hypothetical protein